MASKKREIQLQAVINNQSLWDEMMQNKGLTVIDVYQAWCGPCKAMQTLFRKLKNELNEDELLHFAIAEADSIVTLQPFRDKCEPVFLFSVNGTIVAKIQGANAPLVNQKIITLVNEERKIAAGEMVRPQYHEIAFVDSDSEDAGEPSYESVDQIYTIVIIKPDAVTARKVQEIKEKPDFEDFVSFMTRSLSYILVVSQGKEKQPSWDDSEVNSEMESKEPWDEQEEMAKPLRMKSKSGPSLALVLVRENGLGYWKQLIGPSNVEEAKEYLPERGTSLVMILTKWNAVLDWRRLMGPTDPEEARLLSPDSIRAQFGKNILQNAVHGASTMEEAMETIGKMFEDFIPENLEEN